MADRASQLIARSHTRASGSQLSSPSKIPGIPTRSMCMPSSASASMFRGCSRARREEKAAEVKYFIPAVGIFNNLGAPGGGGRVFSYRIRAM